MSEEVSGQNQGGRPRKWGSDAERKAATREQRRLEAEQAERDEAYVQAELEITRVRYADDPHLAERLKRSEAYLRKEVAGEIGPRS